MLLDIQQRSPTPDITVLELSGRLQLGNALADAERLIRKLVEQGHIKIVLDCSKLEAIDSAGVGMFMFSSGLTMKAGGQLRVAAPSARVSEVFKMTRVDQVLSIHPDVEEALRSLEGV